MFSYIYRQGLTALNNDKQFESLLKETYRALGFFLRYLGLPVDETEDMVQEVYIKAYNAFDRYESTRPFKSWLFSIAKNTFIDYTRRKKVQRKLLESSFKSDFCDSFADDSDKRIQIKEMLSALSCEEQIIIELRFFQDLPFKEIASLTGLTSAAVRMRVFRIMQKLKNANRKDYNEQGL